MLNGVTHHTLATHFQIALAIHLGELDQLFMRADSLEKIIMMQFLTWVQLLPFWLHSDK